MDIEELIKAKKEKLVDPALRDFWETSLLPWWEKHKEQKLVDTWIDMFAEKYEEKRSKTWRNKKGYCGSCGKKGSFSLVFNGFVLPGFYVIDLRVCRPCFSDLEANLTNCISEMESFYWSFTLDMIADATELFLGYWKEKMNPKTQGGCVAKNLTSLAKGLCRLELRRVRQLVQTGC
jgi:hypothetical protein